MLWLLSGFVIVPAFVILASLLGNASTAWLAGVLVGLLVWFVWGFILLLGQAFDGCNSLDPDNMCVETSEGRVYV